MALLRRGVYRPGPTPVRFLQVCPGFAQELHRLHMATPGCNHQGRAAVFLPSDVGERWSLQGLHHGQDVQTARVLQQGRAGCGVEWPADELHLARRLQFRQGHAILQQTRARKELLHIHVDSARFHEAPLDCTDWRCKGQSHLCQPVAAGRALHAQCHLRRRLCPLQENPQPQKRPMDEHETAPSARAHLQPLCTVLCDHNGALDLCSSRHQPHDLSSQ
mmetsp:Transcript_101028/g.326109  ORF Transcript_101028/g.326109 Transcript_101028/m.326109 type:complete len:219 (+) Transcript_101028:571-1227(+)